ncbi:MAG: TolC family protein [Bryobacteraceae bacterium]|jgi:outer membrane protein TolC
MVSRTLLAGILTAAGAFAQMTVFPKPSFFREEFRKPDTNVEIEAPARLKDFVKEGEACQAAVVRAASVNMSMDNAIDTSQAVAPPAPSQYPDKAPSQCLVLSLKDYLGLAMSNHTNVQTYYLTVERSRNNVTSVLGTWDPVARASLTPSWNRSDPALNVPNGSSTRSGSWPLSLGYSQTLQTGQTLSFGGGGYKNTAWGQNTSYGSNMSFSFTQPLIKNRGGYITRLPLIEAQSTLKISQFQLRQSLLGFINTAEGAYWGFISAREQLKVTLTAQDVSKANLDYIQHELQLGAVNEISMYRPEQSYAAAQVTTLQNEFGLKNQEDALRRQIGADIDPNVRDLPVVLTDAPDLSPSEAITPDRELTVQKALNLNPSIKISMETLSADDYGVSAARNGLLPELDLKAGYGGAGYGSTYVPFGGGPVIAGGLGEALQQLFEWGNPGYNIGLSLTLPIRNRTASMAMANAIVQKKTDALSLRSTQQSLRLSVLQGVNSFIGSIAAAKMAVLSREYAQKDYEAQMLEFKLGMNTQLDLVTAAQELATADSAMVTAQIAVRTSLLNLWLQTGELLDQRGIVVR